MKSTFLLLVGILSFTSTLLAQEDSARVMPRVQMAAATLNDAVKYLREAGSVNITLPSSLESLPVPEVSLVNVTAEGVLRSLATMIPEIEVRPITDSQGTTILNIVSATTKPKPSTKVCRVFKASAKERLQGQEMEQLVQNLAEAAKKVCDANARAQGREQSELPTIEAHPPIGILIVTGEESDVQLLGQVVQALGGEVIPLTDTKPAAPVAGTGPVGASNLPSWFEKTRQEVEQTRKQAEQAVKQLQNALESLRPQGKTPEKK